MTEEKKIEASGEEKPTTAMVGVPVAKRKEIDQIIGSEPIDWYNINVMLVRDEEKDKPYLVILDHSRPYLEGVVIEGEPLNRASLPEGAIAQGYKLVVGTQYGDYVFSGVSISICVVTDKGRQITVVSSIVHDDNVIVERLSDDRVAVVDEEVNDGSPE